MIRLRAAEGLSHRAPGRCYGLGPALLSTWIEHAASLDLTYPQPDGEHTGTWPLSTDSQSVPTSPQDRLEQGLFEVATRHRFEEVRSPNPGRYFPVVFSCCRTTLDSLVALDSGCRSELPH